MRKKWLWLCYMDNIICNSGYHTRNLSTMISHDSPDLCPHRIKSQKTWIMLH